MPEISAATRDQKPNDHDCGLGVLNSGALLSGKGETTMNPRSFLKLFTRTEAAELLRVSKPTIDRMRRRGDLDTVHPVGGAPRITEESIRRATCVKVVLAFLILAHLLLFIKTQPKEGVAAPRPSRGAAAN